MRLRRFFFICLLLSYLEFLFLLSGCAYKLKSSHRHIPGGYERVIVPIFVNRSMEPGIEVGFTNSLIQQVQNSKVARIVEDKLAEVKIQGVIESVTYEPQGKRVASDSAPSLPQGAVLASEYRILVKVRVTLSRTSDGQVIWSSPFQGETTYTAPQVTLSGVNTVNPLYNLSARRQNIQTLALDLMTEAFNLMTEGM